MLTHPDYTARILPSNPRSLEIKMMIQDETLANPLQMIFQEDKQRIQSVTYRMNHPFMEDMQTQSRICNMLICFSEVKSLEQYMEMLDQCFTLWFQNTFQRAQRDLQSVINK